MAELACRHGVRVVADEIHAPLVLPGAEFTPYLSVPGSDNAFALAEHLPQLGYIWPEGTYLAWVDCRALGIDTDEPPGGPGVVADLAGPARMFLDRARVALSSGHVFGAGGAGWVRLNFATSQAILTEAVTRMGHAVKRTDPGD